MLSTAKLRADQLQPGQALAFDAYDTGGKLAALLVRTVGICPPGSVVELADRDIPIAVKRTRNANHPVLRCVKTWRNEILEPPRKRMTHEPGHAIARLIPASEPGFAIDHGRMWDGGFAFDAAEESNCQ